MTCPGSPALSKVVGSDYATEAARRGTACHLLLGAWLRGDEIDRLVGVTEPETRIEVTDEMVAMVKDVAKWLFHYVGDRLYRCQPIVRSECRVEVGRAFGCPEELWGWADLVVVSDDEILVADAKFGFWDVDVEGNEQVSLYTIGVAEEYGWPDKTYKLAILQPQSNPPFKVETLTRVELEDRRQQYIPKVKAALQPNAPLVPTERGCEWCPAAARCPALKRRVDKIAEIIFSEPPESLTVDQLGATLRDADMVRNALKAAERYALQAMTLGTEHFPGWKRVAANTHRQWMDEVIAEAMLSDYGKDDDLWVRKLISPAQAEKKFNLPRRSLDAYAPAPPGEPVLVRDSDPRPALDSPFGREE